MKRLIVVAGLLPGLSAPAFAQEPGAAPVPAAVRALAGCWEGSGEVMGKPVTIRLEGGLVAENALFVLDARSLAVADPADRYAAHLVFGGRTRPAKPGDAPAIMGFWADSFGGDYTATGIGAARKNDFAIVYDYPDQKFINHWALEDGKLTWTITAEDASLKEQKFAAYALTRAECSAKPTPP